MYNSCYSGVIKYESHNKNLETMKREKRRPLKKKKKCKRAMNRISLVGGMSVVSVGEWEGDKEA